MNKSSQLLSAIADECHIRRGASESATEYKTRLIYSALCRAGYASLFDEPADDEQIGSLRHFKDRIDALQKIYLELYPEAQLSSELSSEIYKLYSSVGCIYHSPHRICASMPCAVESNEILFLRGVFPSRGIYMSGAGFYSFSEGAPFFDGKIFAGLDEMFALSNKTLLETWAEIIRSATFRSENLPDDVEFLRTSPPFYHDYWKSQPDRDGAVSIARIGESGSRLYYLYKFDGEHFLCRQLPSWLVDGGGYRLVSNACLAARGTLPPIKFTVDGVIVRAELGYLPLPPELNLLRLYSWSREPSDAFNRTFDTEIFFALKKILERLGYTFEGVII